MKEKLNSTIAACRNIEANADDLKNLLDTIKEAEELRLSVDDLEEAYETFDMLHKQFSGVPVSFLHTLCSLSTSLGLVNGHKKFLFQSLVLDSGIIELWNYL